MDLISREAAIEAMKKWAAQPVIMKSRHFEPKGKAIVLDMIGVVTELPIVPAVPLDKLCDLLSKHVGKIRCNDCWVACSDPCPGTADDWRRVVTKWMEGLDDHR